MTTLYLNKNGSRWRNFNKDGSPETGTWTTVTGGKVTRTIKYWEHLGTLIVAVIKYNNRLFSVLPDTILPIEKTKTRNFK
jgi:hypothetical protein